MIAKTYDNIYVDSATGVTELMYRTPEMQMAIKKNSWDGFRVLAEKVEELMLKTKELTEDGKTNIFYTVSLVPTKEGGLEPEAKGSSVTKNIRAIFPIVVALMPQKDEEGNALPPRLITSSMAGYSARLDDILIQHNPGSLDANLTTLIKFLKGDKV